jgi:hypothetical protein
VTHYPDCHLIDSILSRAAAWVGHCADGSNAGDGVGLATLLKAQTAQRVDGVSMALQAGDWAEVPSREDVTAVERPSAPVLQLGPGALERHPLSQTNGDTAERATRSTLQRGSSARRCGPREGIRGRPCNDRWSRQKPGTFLRRGTRSLLRRSILSAIAVYRLH